tara:strand:+ start:16889 stop:17191 length:303 start_codon:yes stop_codon:yes gene_type:complete
MTHPRDFTTQEQLFAKVLDKFGIRYEQQVVFNQYTVDFFVSELNAVIEADGVFGHLRKADRQRDQALLEFSDVDYVFHISEKTEKEIEIKMKGIFDAWDR